jgi:hypothetical protein
VTVHNGNLLHGALAHPWFGEVDWDRLATRQITTPYLPRPKINGKGDWPIGHLRKPLKDIDVPGLEVGRTTAGPRR